MNMPKISKEQLDKDEIKIITELQQYSNKSIDIIAEHCGFSRQKVWKTIKKMEEKNLIWGYTTIVDEQQQGLQKFILLLKRSMKLLDTKTVDDIALSRLQKDYDEVGITIESSYYIHGEYDWVLIFTANDLKHAKKLSTLLMKRYPGVIAKVNLMQILHSQREHNIRNPNPTTLRDFL